MERERIIVEGTVTHGRRLGHRLGFPTANLDADGIEAPDGVYASRAEVDGRWYAAMSNLGSNPTVGGRRRKLETHLFDFDAPLYGRRLRVELVAMIRTERRFASIEALQRQLDADAVEARRRLAPHNDNY